jgi:hypothetical protein
MWLLHFLPDSFLLYVINIMCIAGIVSTILGFFLGWVPGIRSYKLPLQLVGVILLAAGLYFKGGYSTEMEWRARVEEMQKKVNAAEQKSKKANAHLKTKIVTKVKVIHDTKVVIKDRIVNQAASIDAECKVNADAISILNQAAKTPEIATPTVVVKPGDVK